MFLKLGEKLFILPPEGVGEDEMSASVAMETDDSLQNSTTLPTMEDDSVATETTGIPKLRH